MTPKKLVLRRVCQHAEKEIIFSDGLNSIEGPNGSGKSNILHSLCLCLGQDTNLVGKKTDMIQDGYEKAEIFLEFVHRDAPGTIKVTLKRNYPRNWDEQSLLMDQAKYEVQLQHDTPTYVVAESTMKLATFSPKETTAFTMEWMDTKCRNGTELQDWMRREVGVDPKLIVSTFFPSQGDIDGALSADKTERQAVFSAKAGTGLCEVIWNLLGQELRGLEDFSGIEERHAQAKAAAAICAAKVHEIKPLFTAVSQEDRNAEKWNTVIRGYIQGAERQKKLGELLAEHSSLQGLLTRAQADLENQLGIGKTLGAKFAELGPQRDALMQRITLAESSAQREIQRRKLGAELVGVKEQLRLALAAVPQDPPSDADLTALAGQVAGYENEAKRISQYLDVFRKGSCPTCGAIVAAPEKIQGLEVDLKAAQDALRSTSTRQVSLGQARRQLHAAKMAWEAQVIALKAKIAQLDSTLASMPPQTAEVSPADLEASRAQLTEIKEVEAALQAARTTYTSTSVLVERYTTATQGLTKQCQELTEALKGAPLPQDYQDAQTGLARAQESQVRFNDLQVQLGIAEGRLKDAQGTLLDIEASMGRVGPQRTWRDRIEKARALMHRDAMPSEVVAWYASSLVGHTMTYLKLFEIGFEVMVTPDLGLLAVFPDKAMPVHKLSGGEKNMLNISMRLAMADLFPSDLRLLVLDEVEVHLDQTNVAKLPVLLGKVKSLARNRGLVVLFVSHHPCLRDIADNVIYARAG